MMLQIDHRESRDIDIFLPDPQFLPFLNPQMHDFEFEIRPHECRGDGARSLKLTFRNIGEIDFIVGGTLTDTPTIETDVDGQSMLLETIPEIITKKVYHRASSIQPRDIFDIAAAGEQHAGPLIASLTMYRDHVTQALTAINKLKADVVNRVIQQQLAIKEGYKEVAKTALERCKELLRAV
jgi:nucleotidyltransferase AbiEii toxin of type IV toxin-antitoxin system